MIFLAKKKKKAVCEEKAGESKLDRMEVGRAGEMRLQLIVGLAADVPRESNSLQPVCFHGNRIRNYRAWALPLPFSQQGGG